MKKVISLALTLAMLCCMATTAFAANNKHIVGEHGKSGTVADGASTANFNNPDVEVAITVTTGDVESRYAVDIDYDTMSLNIDGADLVWDVNKLDYVAADGSTTTDEPEEKEWFSATVTNYSDNAVFVTATVTDSYDDDGIDVAIVDAANSTNAKTINHQELGDAKDHTAKTLPFAVMVSCTDWDAAAAYHANALAGASKTVTVATCRVVVAAS